MTQTFLQTVGPWTDIKDNSRAEELQTLLREYFGAQSDSKVTRFRDNSGYLEFCNEHETEGFVITSKGEGFGKLHMVRREIARKKYVAEGKYDFREFTDSDNSLAGFAWRTL